MTLTAHKFLLIICKQMHRSISTFICRLPSSPSDLLLAERLFVTNRCASRLVLVILCLIMQIDFQFSYKKLIYTQMYTTIILCAQICRYKNIYKIGPRWFTQYVVLHAESSNLTIFFAKKQGWYQKLLHQY